jgi:hypothetical protein
MKNPALENVHVHHKNREEYANHYHEQPVILLEYLYWTQYLLGVNEGREKML